MPQLRIILILGCLFAATSSLHAQSLSNTNWRALYPPINDTVTLHFTADTATITTTTGVHVLRSAFKQSGKNLITFMESHGMSGCPDLPGSYHVDLAGGYLTFTMDEDPCDGRGGSLIGKKWLPMANSDR
jgi:hypothetical protein